MSQSVAGLTFRSTMLLRDIEENPSIKKINKYIANVTEVKNKPGCRFLKKTHNDFFNYSKAHSDLLALKYCQLNFGEKKSAIINQAIAKNLNKIIDRDLAFEPLSQQQSPRNIKTVSEHLAELKIKPENQKMKVPYTLATLAKIMFRASFESRFNAEKAYKLIKNYGHDSKYYDLVDFDETKSTQAGSIPPLRNFISAHRVNDDPPGLIYHDAQGHSYTRC